MAALVTAPDTVRLAAGFTPPSLDDWRALVRRALKGAGPESLVTRDPNGIDLAPLYVASSPHPAMPPPRAVRPKSAPPWDIRALVENSATTAANAELLADLAGGATSALLVIDPTSARGVALGSANEFVALLDGVVLERPTIALDAGFLGPSAAEWLGAAAKASPAAPLAFHLDPLSTFARDGESPGSVAAHVEAAARTAARLAEAYPNATLFRASGRVVHEAGGGAADEIAFALAAAFAYAKALSGSAPGTDGPFDRIVLALSIDDDILVSIAKLRAARIAWAKLAVACGVPAAARIEARSSGRMLTRADAWTNLIRLAVAGFAAAVGGADSVLLDPFTAGLGGPTATARRMALNAQLILMDEANLGFVADPLAGAGAVEALTHDLAREALARLRAIEGAGGLAQALRIGLVAERAEEGREALRGAIAARSLRLVGVTDFRAEGVAAPEVAFRPSMSVAAPDPRQPGPDDACPPLTPITLEALASAAA